jgi:hypothetical protein
MNTYELEQFIKNYFLVDSNTDMSEHIRMRLCDLHDFCKELLNETQND